MSFESGVRHCPAITELANIPVKDAAHNGKRGGAGSGDALVHCPKTCDFSKKLGSMEGNFTITSDTLKQPVSQTSVQRFLQENCPPEKKPTTRHVRTTIARKPR